jgi:hypothetical protein
MRPFVLEYTVMLHHILCTSCLFQRRPSCERLAVQLPERLPHTLSVLALLLLSESNKVNTDRLLREGSPTILSVTRRFGLGCVTGKLQLISCRRSATYLKQSSL